MSERVSERTERDDFQATSDPGLLESADRGEVNLLSYEQLYNLWERQQWATQDIDFTQDRIDWHERFDEEERFQRMYGLAAFFIGEQKVADELGPIMRAALKDAELSATALDMSEPDTRSATKVWRAGVSTALTMPSARAKP